MSFFISALVLILLVVLFVFLGVGVAFVLGIVLLVAAVAALISFVFGGLFGGDGTFSFIQSFNQGHEVPQKFNECLLEQQAEVCLKDWTTWDQSKIEIIQVLAKQVREDLGSRGDSSSKQYASNSINGAQRIELELLTDFEKKKDVKEHYVLVDVNGDIRIDELQWDYK